MNYKYVFFDFDGTLVNTVEGTAESAKYALKQLSINTENIENLGEIFCGPPLKESFSRFLTNENDIKYAIKLYKEYQAKNTIELSKIYDGIKELLKKLKKQGKSLNVVTLKSRETTIKILEFLDICKYFDNIIGMCKECPNQDKKEMLKYATEKIEYNKAIMIGDRKSDIEAGIYCKMDTIAVLYGMESLDILSTANPTFFAKSPNEIYKIICQENCKDLI